MEYAYNCNSLSVMGNSNQAAFAPPSEFYFRPIEVDGNISAINPQNIQNHGQNIWANETNRDIHHHPQSTFHYYDDSVKGESDKNGILTFFFSTLSFTLEHF